jgi:hypothetical protein
LDFESANPSVVKSIKQRDLLNTWLRLYVREQRMPGVEEYQPERLADELPDLVYYTVDTTRLPPLLTSKATARVCRAPTATPARDGISTNISGPD